MHLLFEDPAAQSLHVPDAPHALSPVPAEQVPFEQHPPLQAEWVPVPHVVEQVFVVMLQALPAGQSEAELQPQ